MSWKKSSVPGSRIRIGGATNYGVSLRFLKSLKRAEGDIDLSGEVNAADIRALTVEGAKRLRWRNLGTRRDVQQSCAAPAPSEALVGTRP